MSFLANPYRDLPKLPHFGEKLKKIPLFNEALIAIIIFR
jgi:hypothetical protein